MDATTNSDATTSAGELPSLDVFDEEFAHEPAEILRADRGRSRLWFWVFICLLAGTGASAFALAWPEAVAALRTDLPSFSSTTSAERDAPADEVARLRRQIDELKQELQEISVAHQRAEDTIASLRSSEPEAHQATWFSEPAGLLHGIVVYAETTAPRATVTARPRTGEVRRGPLSLEPQQ